MRERFYIETFENGLTLLAQPVRQVSSAAMTISVSAGAAADPQGEEGAAAVAGKWLLRGAGDMDTRRLHDALDNLGCRHSERVQSEFLTLTAASLGRHLPKLIGLYAQILQQPRLGDDTFEPCRQWTAQELESLEDEPSRKANMLLRQRFYPEPFGRCVYGSEKSLAALSAESVRKHIKGRIAPGSTIVAVAGNVEFEPLLEWVSQAFGPWQAPKPEAVKPGRIQNGRTHIRKDSAQTHITLAHPAAGLDDPEYYRARIVQMVLSGGMASRLFTEVREKRGLVYHVSTRYHAIQHRAGMFTYAGCEPDKAQETFDVTVGELKRLAEGIEDDEIDRAHVQARSSLVMQGESTSARSAAMASDYRHLGRLRSLEEISDALQAVTIPDVLEYLEHWPAQDMTSLTIGPDPVDTAAADEVDA